MPTDVPDFEAEARAALTPFCKCDVQDTSKDAHFPDCPLDAVPAVAALARRMWNEARVTIEADMYRIAFEKGWRARSEKVSHLTRDDTGIITDCDPCLAFDEQELCRECGGACLTTPPTNSEEGKA